MGSRFVPLVMMTIIFVVLFVLGLAFGSFLNAFEYRLHKGIDFVKVRSFCPKCKHTLAPKDLIPLLSFLLLERRCRYCSAKISWQYPVVELLSGFLFVLAGVYVQKVIAINVILDGSMVGWLVAKWLIIYLGLTVLVGLILDLFLFFAIYDLKHSIIPNKVVVPAVVVALVLNVSLVLFQGFDVFHSLITLFYEYHFGWYILAGILAGVFIASVILITRGSGMGGGDLKLVVLMGLLLGPLKFLVAFYFALITGSVIGVIWAVHKRQFKGLKVPFGMFLSFGSIVAFLYGGYILSWYYSAL